MVPMPRKQVVEGQHYSIMIVTHLRTLMIDDRSGTPPTASCMRGAALAGNRIESSPARMNVILSSLTQTRGGP